MTKRDTGTRSTRSTRGTRSTRETRSTRGWGEDRAGLPQGVALTARDERFRDDPHAAYDRLRERAPVHDDPEYGRLFLTRDADVQAVLRSGLFGVDARRAAPEAYVRRIAGTGVREGEGETAYEPPLVLLDDPAHRRIRLLVGKAFNPRSIEAMRGRILELTRSLLDELEGCSEIDFIRDFAGPLPTRVIAEMMGMAPAHAEDYKRWSDDILRGYDPERSAAQQARLREAYVAMTRHFREGVAERRASPREDLISRMTRAQEEDDRLSDLEIISLCTQLLVAGNVTTTDLMGNGLHALMEHPEQMARLRAEPGRIGSAIEEILRYDCPITETARIALDEAEVGGCPVHAGRTITASLAAANHDPEVHPEPHRFDIERRDGSHLAFGAGVHFCLGAPLARLEGRIGLGEFLARFPDVRPGPQPPRRRDLPSFRGFETLPVRLR